MTSKYVRATRRNTVEGARIQATGFGVGRVRTGTVDYVERDYDGRTWRWLVVFTNDETGKTDCEWLGHAKVARPDGGSTE